jgi:hypothetical protein
MCSCCIVPFYTWSVIKQMASFTARLWQHVHLLHYFLYTWSIIKQMASFTAKLLQHVHLLHYFLYTWSIIKQMASFTAKLWQHVQLLHCSLLHVVYYKASGVLYSKDVTTCASTAFFPLHVVNYYINQMAFFTARLWQHVQLLHCSLLHVVNYKANGVLFSEAVTTCASTALMPSHVVYYKANGVLYSEAVTTCAATALFPLHVVVSARAPYQQFSRRSGKEKVRHRT